jgi:hypothetical protein
MVLLLLRIVNVKLAITMMEMMFVQPAILLAPPVKMKPETVSPVPQMVAVIEIIFPTAAAMMDIMMTQQLASKIVYPAQMKMPISEPAIMMALLLLHLLV